MSSRHSSRMPSHESIASPVSLSPLERTQSVISVKRVEHPPTPESPSPPLPHKRAAVHFDHIKKAPVDDSRPCPRDRTASHDFAAGHICFCPPEAKIPRPRNAFILYRQHHQAGILAKIPGLSNPEISKLVGEHWNKLPPAAKEDWKRLADEEALRHAQQYPNYKYQPKRPGTRRTSTADSPTTISPTGQCIRCGGSCGTSPMTPASLAAPSQIKTSTPPTAHITSIQPPPAQGNGKLISSPGGMARSAVPAQLHLDHQVPVNGNSIRPVATTPEAKRRRYTNGTYLPPSAGTPIYKGYPPSAPHYRDSFAHIEPAPRYVQSSPLTMGPPPRPLHPVPYQPHPLPEQPHLRGPTLPPLQLPVQAPKLQSNSPPTRILPMNFFNKIVILARIAPPLAHGATNTATRHTSPTASRRMSSKSRGAIAAVEGEDLDAVSQTVTWLGEFMSRTEEYQVRTAQGPEILEEGEQRTIRDYLDLVRDWHGKSDEMIDFITAASSTSCPRIAVHPDTNSKAQDTTSDNALTNDVEAQHEYDADQYELLASSSTAIPLILLSRYQFHASNAFSTAISLTGAYTPIDHWQWMATLWRGTIGPDVTVYLKDYLTPDDINKDMLDGTSSEMSGARKAAAEILGKCKGVEVREEKGVCVVVIWKRKGERVEEGTLRRVAFEIGEAARAVWEGKGASGR